MAIKTSKHKAELYAAYKASNRQATNRKRKLLKLQKQHPKNLQIADALKNIKYRRKTPKSPHWSHSAIYFTKLFKTFKKPGVQVVPMLEKKMFSIATRIKGL